MLRLDDLASTQKNFPLMENRNFCALLLPIVVQNLLNLMLYKKLQPLSAQKMPDGFILRKFIDDILRIDHNGRKKSHFVPRLSDL